MPPLPDLHDPDFLDRPAATVAEALLGQWLVRDEVVLRITETEAYAGDGDTASHASRGRTPRNAPMFGPPGRAYVYLCYGIHQLLNITVGPVGAVLVRACEPVRGLETIRSRRGGKEGPVLLTGPGKVGAALAVDTSWSGHDLLAPGGLELRRGSPPERVVVGPRVGIGYAASEDVVAPLRFADGGSRWVSHPRDLAPR